MVLSTFSNPQISTSEVKIEDIRGTFIRDDLRVEKIDINGSFIEQKLGDGYGNIQISGAANNGWDGINLGNYNTAFMTNGNYAGCHKYGVGWFYRFGMIGNGAERLVVKDGSSNDKSIFKYSDNWLDQKNRLIGKK